jgi:predicted lipoprotein
VNNIVSLNGIFDENVVARNIKHHISFNSEVVSAVNSQSSVKGLMGRVTSDVGVVHVSNHVEVDGVPAQLKGLTHVCEFTVA